MIKKLAIVVLALSLLAIVSAWLYVAFTQETKTLDDKTRKEIGGSFISLSKGNTYYELNGPDTGKTAILIHGAGSGSYAWDNNFDYLAQQGFRVLRYDLYGRGFSDRPDVMYDTTLFHDQLVELTDSFQLTPPYHLVAVSMGSSVAIHFAHKHLNKVASLTLVDPASLGNGTLPWHLKTPVISPALMSLYWYPRAVEKQMKEFYDPNKVAEYREKSWEQLKYKGLKNAMLSTWQHMLTLNMKQHMEKIGTSSVAVLLVWGKYDPLVPPAASKEYRSAMPQAKYVEMDSAGHLSSYERPDVFNPAVTNFIKGLK
jgi:pimeloyl-ACP methyl ester carboxylesterase